jgi:hypothetical protein
VSEGWQKLNDGETYKVYRDVNGFLDWLICRYTVAAPNGEVVACCSTRWGARRAIRKHQRKQPLKWWDKPIVEEVPR